MNINNCAVLRDYFWLGEQNYLKASKLNAQKLTFRTKCHKILIKNVHFQAVMKCFGFIAIPYESSADDIFLFFPQNSMWYTYKVAKYTLYIIENGDSFKNKK